jgi:hypothetical protein
MGLVWQAEPEPEPEVKEKNQTRAEGASVVIVSCEGRMRKGEVYLFRIIPAQTRVQIQDPPDSRSHSRFKDSHQVGCGIEVSNAALLEAGTWTWI